MSITYSGTVDPLSNQHVSVISQRNMRIVYDPVDLPSGLYSIWYDIGDYSSVESQAMFALNRLNLDYYIRIPASAPDIWSNWRLINPSLDEMKDKINAQENEIDMLRDEIVAIKNKLDM